jgi:hypothetical protein
VTEAHDMGTQLVTDTDGVEFLSYVTVAYWHCEKCKQAVTVFSKVDRLLLREMFAPEDIPAERLRQDKETVAMSRARHACQPHPSMRAKP